MNAFVVKSKPFMRKVLLAACLYSGVSQSQGLDGNFLHFLCNQPSTSSPCFYLVMGIIEGANYQADIVGIRRQFCAPVGVNFQQMKDIFVQYLNAHPEFRHHSISQLVIQAQKEKFPCSR